MNDHNDAMARLRAQAQSEPVAPRRLSIREACDLIEEYLDADPALLPMFRKRFAKCFADAPTAVSLDPFPSDPGTVEASIWDNQPNGKREKVEGDKSRDKPARYAVSIKAHRAGCKTPFTTPPDFRANVGDLFTPLQVRERVKKAWKGIDEGEADFLLNRLVPYAESEGMLVARLMLNQSAKQGGGKHWHPYHYALISEQELIDRAVSGIMLMTGPDTGIMLPPCSTTGKDGDPFELVWKDTRAGAKSSIVIGQSRVTDITSPAMSTYSTGQIT